MFNKLILFICTFFIVTGCTGSSNDNPNVSEMKLVDTLSNGESFHFRGLEWFITDDELKKQEDINNDHLEINTQDPLIFKYMHPITFEEVDLNVDFIVYNFYDEPTKFVSALYIATFEDKEEYLATANKVKSAFETEFIHFAKYGKFDPNHSYSSVNWVAEDESGLTLLVYDDNGRYTISIKSNAPYSAKDIIDPDSRSFFQKTKESNGRTSQIE